MLICETDCVRSAESDAEGSDPNSGGKKEEIDSDENQDSGEKLFTESQVNKIVQMRLEKDRFRVDKEVENRLKELGIESPEDAEASREWRREREELLESTSREQALLRNEMAERESRLGEQTRAHEAQKREWRLKYYLLIKRASTRGAGTTTLNNMLTLDCGQPLEDFHLISNSYYRRDWEKCIIIVNPKTGSTGTISLGGSYTDIETGGSVSSIVLPAKSGAILIEQ